MSYDSGYQMGKFRFLPFFFLKKKKGAKKEKRVVLFVIKKCTSKALCTLQLFIEQRKWTTEIVQHTCKLLRQDYHLSNHFQKSETKAI